MEILQLLGAALGLGAVSGLNLYLTVFATGLAIQQHWIVLAPQYSKLAVLGDPGVVLIAGVLYFIEFFADKIPWIDSLWDTVHTVIRPLGGAFIATRVLGTSDPAFDVVIAVLAGGVSLTTHGLKAATRLVVNASPEPFSNIALSFTEDVTVLGGLALIHLHPIAALVVVVIGMGLTLFFGPCVLRAITTRVWLAWKKFTSGPDDPKLDAADLSKTVPPDTDMLLRLLESSNRPIEWAVPCLCGGSKRLRANLRGHLVALQGDTDHLYFVSKGRLRKAAETIEINGYKAGHESCFLSENLVLYAVDQKPTKRVFVFPRPQRRLVIRLVDMLNARLARVGEG